MTDLEPIIRGTVRDMQRMRDELRECGIPSELLRPPGAKTNA